MQLNPSHKRKREDWIRASLEVIGQYKIRLSLRQIFYRLVANHFIKPPHTEGDYKFLSKTLVWARLNGFISWNAIEDRTRRFLIRDFSESDPSTFFDEKLDAFEFCFGDYELPYWLNQPEYIEVWCEKQALEPLFYEVLKDYRVTLGICRGYPSASWMYEAAIRFEKKLIEVQNISVLYFGDFDPSGKDIDRHIEDRLSNDFGVPVNVIRIAITPEQIKKYNIPPMPVKRADSRSRRHIENYGNVSVELDAIDPPILQDLLREAVLSYFDSKIFKRRNERLKEERKEVKELVEEKLG